MNLKITYLRIASTVALVASLVCGVYLESYIAYPTLTHSQLRGQIGLLACISILYIFVHIVTAASDRAYKSEAGYKYNAVENFLVSTTQAATGLAAGIALGIAAMIYTTYM